MFLSTLDFRLKYIFELVSPLAHNRQLVIPDNSFQLCRYYSINRTPIDIIPYFLLNICIFLLYIHCKSSAVHTVSGIFNKRILHCVSRLHHYQWNNVASSQNAT